MQATRACAIQGCERPYYGRGWCRAHHARWLRHGDPLAGRRPDGDGVCTVDDCAKPHKSLGYCDMHLSRHLRHGDISTVKARDGRGEQSRQWRGDDAGYVAVHDRIRRQRGLPTEYPCADCGGPAKQWAYDHKDPNERIAIDHGKPKPYSTDVSRYQPLCLRCHRRLDHSIKGAT